MSESIYIKSTSNDPELTNDGRIPVWCLYVTNRGNGNIVAVASEGAFNRDGFFTSLPFSCRRVQIAMQSTRLTAKVRQLGIDGLTVALVSEGRAPLDYKFEEAARAA